MPSHCTLIIKSDDRLIQIACFFDKLNQDSNQYLRVASTMQKSGQLVCVTVAEKAYHISALTLNIVYQWHIA